MDKEIFYVAIARQTDKVVVTHFKHKANFRKAVDEVLAAPDFASAIKPKSRWKLNNADKTFNFQMDEHKMVYIVVTSASYPERIAFALLGELAGQFASSAEKAQKVAEGQLDRTWSRNLKELCLKYSDPDSQGKFSEVRGKIEQVRGKVAESIKLAMENIDKAERLEQDAEDLKHAADKFHNQARAVKCNEIKKNYKMWGLIIGVVVIFIIIIVAVMAGRGGGSSSSGGNSPSRQLLRGFINQQYNS